VRIVTTDGAGPYSAILDPTAPGAFGSGIGLKVTTQVPREKGNIKPANNRDGKSFIRRALTRLGIMKRAANANEDYPFAASIPAGTKCASAIAGQQNICLLKILNPSTAGPFGGVVFRWLVRIQELERQEMGFPLAMAQGVKRLEGVLVWVEERCDDRDECFPSVGCQSGERMIHCTYQVASLSHLEFSEQYLNANFDAEQKYMPSATTGSTPCPSN
jgi:hypothetical protein